MDLKIEIRDENDGDINAISEGTAAAFKSLEMSNQREQYIIEALRKDNALTISLVAELDDRVIGHIPRGTVNFHEGFKTDR